MLILSKGNKICLPLLIKTIYFVVIVRLPVNQQRLKEFTPKPCHMNRFAHYASFCRWRYPASGCSRLWLPGEPLFWSCGLYFLMVNVWGTLHWCQMPINCSVASIGCSRNHVASKLRVVQFGSSPLPITKVVFPSAIIIAHWSLVTTLLLVSSPVCMTL